MKKLKKAIFLFIIKTGFSKKVNKIIFEEFLEKNNKKNAMIFVKEYRIIQYFKCYKYKRIDKKCKNVMKCDYCANKHETNKYSKNEIEITHK